MKISFLAQNWRSNISAHYLFVSRSRGCLKPVTPIIVTKTLIVRIRLHPFLSDNIFMPTRWYLSQLTHFRYNCSFSPNELLFNQISIFCRTRGAIRAFSRRRIWRSQKFGVYCNNCMVSIKWSKWSSSLWQAARPTLNQNKILKLKEQRSHRHNMYKETNIDPFTRLITNTCAFLLQVRCGVSKRTDGMMIRRSRWCIEGAEEW